MSRFCRVCASILEYDSVTPFCDSCWSAALHKNDAASVNKILHWIVEVPEYTDED